MATVAHENFCWYLFIHILGLVCECMCVYVYACMCVYLCVSVRVFVCTCVHVIFFRSVDPDEATFFFPQC